ncbi:ATP-binding protein [Natronorubrum sp. FCH18a]|uniref:ATP-binding protein n=1 Tax=Natronorubrum sp. FCH18a TaxID=3447018 RepID=UPI003F50D4FA
MGLLGGLYLVFAAGRALFEIDQGEPGVNILVITLLVGIPGFFLVYGVYWLSRADINSEFYPDIAGWCFAGFGLMVCLLVIYHLQPGESVSTRAPPVLTALASVAGFAVGINDGRAKTRTHEVEARNHDLHQAQTELEKAVDQLEASNHQLERYREYTDDILDAIHDIFYVLEADGTLHRWNGSLCEITGYTDSEIASMHAVELFEEDNQEQISEVIELGFETGGLQIESEILTKDGSSIPYEFAASTLDNPDGETVLAGIGRNVSDRKAREEQLSQRARQQQVVADLGQAALEADDLDEFMHEVVQKVANALDAEYCKVLDLNEEGEDLLLRQGVGWDDGLVGETSVSSVDDESQAAYTLANDHPIVVEDLETETRFSGPELLTNHDVRSGISTVIGPFDDPWGILGVHDTDGRVFTEEDVSFVQSVANVLAEAIERHQYQQELEASNERLEQFAYAASHDLQEPLRMVSSYLQLIESRYGEEFDEDGEEFLEFAIDGAERMRSMIDGLLTYSRVETQGDPLEPVDLEEVLKDVRDDLQVMIAANDATITADSLPRIKGDPDQIRQVFQNLLDNAIEYSGDNTPEVHVLAQWNGAKWMISVRDEGVGIDPDDQDRVFQVFQQAHSRSDGSGTGIGLAICRRIIERHRGEIWVDSNPGNGTTFSFTLPAA